MVHRSIQIEKGVPGYATINPNTNTAYICYTSSNFIIVVNLEKGTIDNKIQLTCPGSISINRVTNKVYVSTAYGICEIDSVNNQYEMINIGLPHSDGSVDVNPLTILLYTTCFGRDILSVIDAQIGFAFNHSNNTIYMMRRGERSILKFDALANELLDITTLEQSSIMRRIFGFDFKYFAEVIAVNTSTNKVYVSDSKNNLLYEIDG